MIIRAGENVYCVEVENALLQHPAVKEAAVIGLAHPMLGEQVAAVIVVGPNEPLNEEDLKQFLSTHLAAYKIPTCIEFRRALLPRSHTGKLLKNQIRTELSVTSGSK